MLDQNHIDLLVSQSGLSQETLAISGAQSVGPKDAELQIGISCSGISFPYFNLCGDLLGYRIKLDSPLPDGGKYLQSKNSELRIYFVKEDLVGLHDHKVPLYITEGEKKTLALRQALKGVVCVGIPGCWGWGDGKIFDDIVLSKRKVVILPDSDWLTNPNVWAGYTELAKGLFDRGADVDIVHVGSKNDLTKIGVDDFLLAGGDLTDKLKTPFWKFRRFDGTHSLPIAEVARESVFLGPIETVPIIKAISRWAHLTYKVVETELKRAANKFYALRPKTAKEKLEIHFDNIRNDQNFLYSMLGSRLETFDHFFQEQVTGNLVAKESKGLIYFNDGPDFAQYLSDLVPFTVGRYDKDGIFKSHGTKILDGQEANGFLKSLAKHVNLRTIAQFSKTPVLLGNAKTGFKLICKRGYDENHCVFYDGPELKPSKSMKYVLEAFKYPWATPEDEATAIMAAIGATFFRIPGKHPAILTIGDRINLGKSNYLKSLAILSGKLPGSADFKPTNEEFAKEILAHIDEEFILIDNIKEPIVSSATLERIITDEVAELRILGTPKKRSRLNTIQFMASINGGKFSEDLITRSIPLFLSSKRKLGHNDLLPFVREHREEILGEMLGMVDRWIESGSPLVPVPAFDKFQFYGSVLAGIAQVNGLVGVFSRLSEAKNKLDLIQSSFLEASYEELDNQDRSSTQARSVKEIVGWLSGIYGHGLLKDYQTLQAKYNATAQRLSEMVDQTFPFHSFDRSVGLEVSAQMAKGQGAGRKKYLVKMTLPTLPEKLSVVGKYDDVTEENGKIDTGRLCSSRAGKKQKKYFSQNSIESELSVNISDIENNINILSTDTGKNPSVVNHEKTSHIKVVSDDTQIHPPVSVVSFQGISYKTTWWRVGDGCIGGSLSYDIETPVVSDGENRPVVLASAFNGETVFFINPKDLPAFIAANKESEFIAHNSAFDLVHTASEISDRQWVFDLADKELITDTFLLARLINLATTGDSQAKGCSLDACVEKYLGEELPKDITVNGELVRTSYGKYLGRIHEAPQEYFTYNAIDTIATFKLAHKLKDLTSQIAIECYADPELMLSHHLQVKTLLASTLTTLRGISLDKGKVEVYYTKLQCALGECDEKLKALGYWSGKGSQDRLNEVLSSIEKTHSVCLVKKYHKSRKKEVYSSKANDLKAFAGIPFVDSYLEREKIAKLQSTFIAPLRSRDRIFPTFDVLKETGRTSSRNPNSQNFPTMRSSYDGVDIRSCFVARSGHLFYIVDFTGAELASWGQYCKDAYGYSKMADMISSGQDVHSYVTAKYLGISETEVTKDQRQCFGKLANFGLIGGAGPTRLQAEAAKNGAKISIEDAKKLVQTWREAFPESIAFFADAQKAQLSALKLRDKRKLYTLVDCASGLTENRFGTPYREEDITWAFDHLAKLQLSNLIPFQDSILQQRGSIELGKALESVRLATLPKSGRARANTNYSEFLNTFIQGAQADVTNLAWYRLEKEGFAVINAVHDEFVIEVPKQNEELSKTEIEKILINTAREFYPDISMKVEGGFCEYWKKI